MCVSAKTHGDQSGNAVRVRWAARRPANVRCNCGYGAQTYQMHISQQVSARYVL